ncbi:MAG: hypothetical protein WBG92_08725 [Thiohalocapsa sp.]
MQADPCGLKHSRRNPGSEAGALTGLLGLQREATFNKEPTLVYRMG